MSVPVNPARGVYVRRAPETDAVPLDGPEAIVNVRAAVAAAGAAPVPRRPSTKGFTTFAVRSTPTAVPAVVEAVRFVTVTPGMPMVWLLELLPGAESLMPGSMVAVTVAEPGATPVMLK